MANIQSAHQHLNAGYDDIYEHLNKRNNFVYDGFDFPVFTFRIDTKVAFYVQIYMHIERYQLVRT